MVPEIIINIIMISTRTSKKNPEKESGDPGPSTSKDSSLTRAGKKTDLELDGIQALVSLKIQTETEKKGKKSRKFPPKNSKSKKNKGFMESIEILDDSLDEILRDKPEEMIEGHNNDENLEKISDDSDDHESYVKDLFSKPVSGLSAIGQGDCTSSDSGVGVSRRPVLDVRNFLFFLRFTLPSTTIFELSSQQSGMRSPSNASIIIMANQSRILMSQEGDLI